MFSTSLLITVVFLLGHWGVECHECDREMQFDATYKGEIKSPGYATGRYEDSLNCYYKIKAPEGYRIKLTFKDLDIDPTASCGFDKLWISGKGGEGILAVVCGTKLPNPVMSKEGENEITMTFNTDYMVSGRGFHLVYESGPDLKLCDGQQKECRNRNCFHETKRCDGNDDCGDGTDEENCGYPLVYPSDSNCGATPIEPDTSYSSPDRQVGGTEAIPHSWPWQVSLQHVHTEPNAHFCGGALIAPQYVVTAAHCVVGTEDPSLLRIVLGSHNKYEKSKYETTRVAARIVAYPDLEGEKLRGYYVPHDIAIIKLNAPVKYNDGIQPVCVPFLGWEASPGWNCFSTGWGETRGSGFSDQLKQTVQTIQSKDNCTFDEKTQICVDKPFNSPCHGDSGGPLSCKLGNKWYLMGAVSYATASNMMSGLCGMPDNRAIFAKVSEKSDWIQKMITQFG